MQQLAKYFHRSITLPDRLWVQMACGATALGQLRTPVHGELNAREVPEYVDQVD